MHACRSLVPCFAHLQNHAVPCTSLGVQVRSSGLLTSLATSISEEIHGMDLWSVVAIFCGVVLVGLRACVYTCVYTYTHVCERMCMRTVAPWIDLCGVLGRECACVYVCVLCLCVLSAPTSSNAVEYTWSDCCSCCGERMEKIAVVTNCEESAFVVSLSDSHCFMFFLDNTRSDIHSQQCSFTGQTLCGCDMKPTP